MHDQNDVLNEIFVACWKDEALKARFITEPKVVMVEYGLEISEEVEVRVLENSDDRIHLTIPAFPPEDISLSDEELEGAAGGKKALHTMELFRHLTPAD